MTNSFHARRDFALGRSRALTGIAVGSILALGGLSGCKSSPSGPTPSASGIKSASADATGDAKKGRTVFMQFCAPCHGSGGKGDGLSMRGSGKHPPDFTKKEFETASADDLTNSIQNGKPGGMPAFKGRLTDEQVSDLVATVKDFAKYGK